MDVVVEDGRDLLNEFVNPQKVEDEAVSVERESDAGAIPNSRDTWIDIEVALQRWTDQIVDAETRYEKTATFREKIEATLQRQQLDGLLNPQDISELRYITNLWINLLNCTSTYTIGCEFVKHDIITYLLELYKLRQITDSLFIETCLRL